MWGAVERGIKGPWGDGMWGVGGPSRAVEQAKGSHRGDYAGRMLSLLDPRGVQTALKGPGKPRKSACLGGGSVGFQLVV